ncbi:response regulator transcription factor [Listeria sp. FSL L7-1435]|uniref:response regulator n=1 Tax=Listeria cossartiae TaxID=2838249 RepID=UPI00162AA95D|nr:response regulator transcription factor [Listeria cossartiae]MBC1547905.1 response regulator transcription factor [Listeria cossartiae subsp. cossartiae]
MNSKRLVLIVEDEDGISNFISAVLTASDYAVIKATNGKEALEQTASHSPDVVLLDLGLPDMEGLDVLRAIRVWSKVPIIVVSARDHEREKVTALDLGADDYITKPFGTSELLARIRTALRHIQPSNKATPNDHIIQIQNLYIDDDRRLVKMGAAEIHFTPIEYKILLLLARHAGKVLTHDFIIREIWGPYSSENQALRVNMSNIRRKIEKNPAEPAYILTEVGVGYRMAEE